MWQRQKQSETPTGSSLPIHHNHTESISRWMSSHRTIDLNGNRTPISLKMSHDSHTGCPQTFLNLEDVQNAKVVPHHVVFVSYIPVFSFKPAPIPSFFFLTFGTGNQALTESCCHLIPVKKAPESSASVTSSIFGFSLLSPLSEEDWCPDMTAGAKPNVTKTDFRGDRGHSCSVTVQGEILAAHLLSCSFFFSN